MVYKKNKLLFLIYICAIFMQLTSSKECLAAKRLIALKYTSPLKKILKRKNRKKKDFHDASRFVIPDAIIQNLKNIQQGIYNILDDIALETEDATKDFNNLIDDITDDMSNVVQNFDNLVDSTITKVDEAVGLGLESNREPLKGGNGPNDNGFNQTTNRAKYEERLNLLLKNYNFAEKDLIYEDGNTILHLLNGYDYRHVKDLLNRHPELHHLINHKNNEGLTPALKAATKLEYNTIEALVGHGNADLSLTDHNGRTALHIAAVSSLNIDTQKADASFLSKLVDLQKSSHRLEDHVVILEKQNSLNNETRKHVYELKEHLTQLEEQISAFARRKRKCIEKMLEGSFDQKTRNYKDQQIRHYKDTQGKTAYDLLNETDQHLLSTYNKLFISPRTTWANYILRDHLYPDPKYQVERCSMCHRYRGDCEHARKNNCS